MFSALYTILRSRVVYLPDIQVLSQHFPSRVPVCYIASYVTVMWNECIVQAYSTLFTTSAPHGKLVFQNEVSGFRVKAV